VKGQEKHPVLPLVRVTRELILGAGSVAEAERRHAELLRARADGIEAERHDALRCGWNAPIWYVMWALLGMARRGEDWVRRTGMEWDEWARRTRERLGFADRVRVLLVSGANRSGKSEGAAKTVMETLMGAPMRNVWCFHTGEDSSRDQQQPLIWKMMPPQYRVRDVRGRETYIAYKRKTGFAERSFVLPNGGMGGFKFYGQETFAHEGAELDGIWADELIPPDLLETMTARTATRDGFFLVTFTPVSGWTATVQMFLQGAETTMWEPGFALPADGKEPDEARGLGFRDAEDREGAGLYGIEAVAREDCLRWAWPDWKPGYERVDRAGLAVARMRDGREFELVPRAMRCARLNWGVLFFHPFDNPYGNPRAVWEQWVGQPRDKRLQRLYGKPTKTWASQFPKFSRSVHVVPAGAIPGEGENYMLIDPTPGGRPWACLWIRATRAGCYVYREWPGRDYVPGLGVMGPWAVPSGAKNGVNDGRRGSGQDPIGWGIRAYLREWGRLEGWTAEALRAAEKVGERPPAPGAVGQGGGDPDGDEPEERADGWLPGDVVPRRRMFDAAEEVDAGADGYLDDGAREKIEQRYIDSRAASSPRMENDRPRTLMHDLLDAGLDVALTPGDDIEEGVRLVNSLLDYDQEKPVSATNRPGLFFSDECVNTIFAVENWMGADGNKGATKDWVDLLRYFALLGVA
jgi:phage terminase large subunit-like protein